MNWIVSIYTGLLFFLLTPNVLLRLPPKGSPLVVAGVHAVVFVIIFHLTHKLVWELSYSMEGFREGNTNCTSSGSKPSSSKPCCNGTVKPNGNCP